MSTDEQKIDGPNEVMHLDDTLWDRYPSIFNRKNLNRAALFFGTAAFILFVVEIYRIEDYLGTRRSVTDQRTDEQYQRDRQLGCLLVEGKPSDGNPLVSEVRDRYDCPAYMPTSTSSPTASPKPSATSPTRSSTRPPSSTTARPRAATVTIPAPSRSSAPVTAPRGTVTTVIVQGGITTTRTVPVPVTPVPSQPTSTRREYSPNPPLCYPLGLPLPLGC